MKTILSILMILIAGILVVSSLFYYGCSKIANSYALSGGYKITATKVIFDTGLHGLGTRENWEVKGADLNSFKVINRNLAKDINHVYLNGEKVEQADASSFKFLRKTWWKDENYVFKGNKIVSTNPKSFKIVKWEEGLLYAKDEQFVYFDGSIIVGAEPKEFKSIGKGYFKDASHAFLGSQIIRDSDGATFQVINSLFAKDKDKVWKKGDLIVGADPKTFKPLKHPYSRDKFYVFYNTKILSWHPKEFKVLGKGVIWKYARDGQFVFHGNSIVENADPESFLVLGAGFAKDEQHVYRGKSILSDLDPKSFEVLNEKHAKDTYRVIYEQRVIKNADPESFETHPQISNEAKDKNRYYKSGYPSKTNYRW